MSAAPSASAQPIASTAPGDPPPLPKCAAHAAHPVEPFEDAGKSNFLGAASTSAASLEKQVRDFEKGATGYDVRCSVSHADGDLVTLQCQGSSHAQFAGSETIAFARKDSDWQRVKVTDLVSDSNAQGLIDKACTRGFPEGITKSGFESKSADKPFLALFQPQNSSLFVGVGGFGFAGDGQGCNVPLELLAPYLGCGPLASIHRPELVDASAIGKEPLGPLGFEQAGGAGVRVFSVDPRHKAAVDNIQKALDDWANANAKAGDQSCTVSLDTADLFAATCGAHVGTADEVAEGFLFRVSDGARIPAKKFFAQKPSAKSDMAIDCLKPYYQPHDPSAPAIENIPVLDDDSFRGFRLTTSTVRFSVPLMLHRGKGTPLVRQIVPCGTTLTKLGMTLTTLRDGN